MSLFSEHHLAHLAATYGPGLVGGIVLLEAIGLPLPAESLLIATAAALGADHKPGIAWIAVAAALGAVLGDNIGYLIGRTLGWRALRRWGRHIGLTEDRLLLGAYLFRRHGGKVVFFGRFVSILRTYAAFLAGTSKMRWRKFLPANAAGGIVWAGLYTAVSYLAGNWLQRTSGTIDWILAGVAVVVVVVLWLLIRRQSGRLAERAERAYPGPLESPGRRPEGAAASGQGRRER